jgi:uncharacterized protein YndB with AHSA1/START domain
VTAGDRVAVTVTVDVPPDVAFDAFTREIDLWWRRGIKFRASGGRTATPGVLTLEPRRDGRVFEEYAGPSGPAVHEIGRVTTWEPPARVGFTWHATNFVAGESTQVDVTFTPTDSGATRVELVHAGFAALRPDHPVRHGESPPVFVRRLGMWWGDLLSSLREHVATRVTPGG